MAAKSKGLNLYVWEVVVTCSGLGLVYSAGLMAGADIGSVAMQTLLGFCGGFIVSTCIKRD